MQPARPEADVPVGAVRPRRPSWQAPAKVGVGVAASVGPGWVAAARRAVDGSAYSEFVGSRFRRRPVRQLRSQAGANTSAE